MPEMDETSTHSDSHAALQPGSLLSDRYKITRLLGVGGMGRVYLAHDLTLDTDVALKVIRPELIRDEKTLERLKNELIVARKVSHKNVVRIHDIGDFSGVKYLSMTYCSGVSLKDEIKETGPLSFERALLIFTQICEGIRAAHEEGVIHRDLKPGNILLEETDRVFITDFGISRSLDTPDQTQTGVIIGTPAYLSPEQMRGERADHQSDIYALGLVFYEMLTGNLPFESENALIFRSKVPSSLPQKLRASQPLVPAFAVQIIEKCLDPRPNVRYRSVSDLLEDLRKRSVTSRPFLTANWKHISIVAALILISIAGIWFYKRTWTEKKGDAGQVIPPIVAVQSLAILPFINRTGNQELAWIESGMADLLVANLSQAKEIRIVHPDRVFQTLSDLKVNSSAIDQKAIRKISEVLDADWIAEGSLMKAGSSFRVDLKITNFHENRPPLHLKSTASRQEDLLTMSDQLALQIQKQLQLTSQEGEAVHVSSVPVSAQKQFYQGMDSLRSGQYDAAAENFRQAIGQSPEFLRAYLHLSESYENLGEQDKAVEILREALQKQGPSDNRTSSLIRGRLAWLEGDLDKAIQIYSNFSTKFPGDAETLFRLALIYEETGDLKNATTTLAKVIQIDPNHPQAYFNLGKDTVLMGDSEKAINHYLMKALAIHTQLNNRGGEADVLNAMGVAYERLGRYDEAIKYYNDSILLKEKTGNQKGAAKSLTNIAKIYIFQGQFDKAREILGRTEKIFADIGDRQGISDVLNMFGVVSEDQGKYEQALQDYKKALQVRKEIGNDRLTAQSYDNIGQIYYLTGRFDDAQVFWEQALSLRQKIGEESGVVLSLQNMGFLQLAQGKLDKATTAFIDALNKARAIQYENAIAVSLGNLGTIYHYQGRYAAALASYQQAIEILNKLGDKKGIAEYTKWLGALYSDAGAWENAEKELASAMTLAEEISSHELKADLQILLARHYRRSGRLEKLAPLLSDALKTSDAHKYEKASANAHIEQGLLHLSEQRYDESERILRAAFKEASDTSDPWLLLDSRLSLAWLFFSKKQFSEALQHCEQALQMAKQMEVKPYLFRIHVIAGQILLAQNQNAKAAERFRRASEILQEIRKEGEGKLKTDWSRLDFHSQLDDGLKRTS